VIANRSPIFRAFSRPSVVSTDPLDMDVLSVCRVIMHIFVGSGSHFCGCGSGVAGYSREMNVCAESECVLFRLRCSAFGGRGCVLLCASGEMVVVGFEIGGGEEKV